MYTSCDSVEGMNSDDNFRVDKKIFSYFCKSKVNQGSLEMHLFFVVLFLMFYYYFFWNFCIAALKIRIK